MRAYFHAGKPVYPWFDHLNRVVGSLDAAYETGYAAHLDLVQEATNPTWSRLASVRPAEASVLLQADLPFLRWEIGAFSLELVLCNGRTVFDQIMGLLNGTLVHTGNAKRTTWWMAQATVGQRTVGVGGWNMPLVRPTGLGLSGEMELGSTLRVAAQSIRPEL
jgi:hypothetical protein